MQNIDTIALAVQWGIILFFVLINFMIGFKRGTKKTLYYTVVSIALTGLLLFGLSLLSIRMFFTPGSLLNLVDKYVTLPSGIRDLLLNEETSAVVFAILDIILKIVIFILLYGLIKFLLTQIIFKRIWKKHIEKTNKTVRKTRIKNAVFLIESKKRVTLGSRFLGSFIGAFRGVFVAFMLLLPLIVITNATTKFATTNNNGTTTNALIEKLSTDSDSSSSEDSDLLKYLKVAQNFSNKGLGALTKKVAIKGKTLDEAVFDLAFSGTVKRSDGTKDKLELGTELGRYIEIGQIAIEQGYLDKGFDVNSISYEKDFVAIKKVLDNLGDSDLLNLVTPSLLEYLYSDGRLTKALGYDVKAYTYTNKAYEKLKSLSFSNEMSSVSNMVKEALLLGNVGELKELVNNLDNFYALDNSSKRRVGNIIEQIGNLEILNGANIFIEYMLQKQDLQSKLSEEDYEDIRERVETLFANPSFLIGEDGDINSISDIIKNIFKDEYDDVDYKTLLAKGITVDLLKDSDVNKLVSEVLVSVSNVETLMNIIPIGLDYVILTTNNTLIKELEDELLSLAEEFDMKDELLNINDIYTKVVALGLANFTLKGSVTKIMDEIFSEEDNFNATKDIINAIFSGSSIINKALDTLSVPLIEKYVNTNEELKELLLSVVDNEDFNVGQEFINLIDLVESAYAFGSLETIRLNITSKNYLGLIDIFGDADKSEAFKEFRDKLLDLQIFKYGTSSAVKMLTKTISSSASNKIVIPESVEYTDVKNDLTRVFDFIYNLAVSIKSQELEVIKNVDIANSFDKAKAKASFTFDAEKDKNSILLNTLVELLKGINISISETTKVGIHDQYKEMTVKDDTEFWVNEINYMIGGLFDYIGGFKEREEELSFDNLKAFSSVKISSISYYIKDNEPITIKSKIIKSILTQTLSSFEGLSIPSEGIDNGLIKDSELDSLVRVLLTIVGEDTTITDISIGTITLGEFKDVLAYAEDSYTITRLLTSVVVEAFGEENIPEGSFTSEDKKYLTQEELQNISEALSVLLEDSDELNVDAFEMVTIGQLGEIIEVDSLLIDKMISDQIVNIETINSEIPLESKDNDGNITHDELLNIQKTLVVIFGNEESIDSLDVTDLEVTLKLYGDLVTLAEETESAFVIRMMSKAIITAFGSEKIASNAYEDESLEDIKIIELRKTYETLSVILTEDEKIEDSAFNSISIKDLGDILAVKSIIINRLISNQIVATDAINSEIPNGSKDVNGNITDDELLNIQTSLSIMFGDEEVLQDIDIANVNISADKYDSLVNLADDSESPFVNRMISKAIITAFGEDEIPNDSYVNSVTKELITITEMRGLGEVLDILEFGSDKDLNDINGAVDIDSLVVKDVEDIMSTYSKISKKLIKDGIYNSFSTYYVNKVEVTDNEAIYLLNSLANLTNEGSNAKVTEVGNKINEVSVSTLNTTIINNESILIERLANEAVSNAFSAEVTRIQNRPETSDFIVNISETKKVLETANNIDDSNSNISNLASSIDHFTVAKLNEINSGNKSILIKEKVNYIISQQFGTAISVSGITDEELSDEVSKLLNAAVILEIENVTDISTETRPKVDALPDGELKNKVLESRIIEALLLIP
ncbi:MAG: hypothetical protein RBQ97_06655 [Acholeplasma sp.]|nr:hypothetical protein [Acholeplasma sp.]